MSESLDDSLSNPLASRVLAARLIESIDDTQVDAVVELQQEIMSTLTGSNQQLDKFLNSTSITLELTKKIESKQDKIKEIQADLMYITQKIRLFKMRLRNQYPEQMDKAELLHPNVELPDD